jgi:hypothetical protein
MDHGIDFCENFLLDSCSTASSINASHLGTFYCFHTRLRFGKRLCDFVCTEVVGRHWRIQSDLCGGWVSMRAHKRGLNAPTDPLTSIYADVYPDPVTRGRALTIFMTVSNTYRILPHEWRRKLVSPNPQYLLSGSRSCCLWQSNTTSSKGAALPRSLWVFPRSSALSCRLYRTTDMIGHFPSWRCWDF